MTSITAAITDASTARTAASKPTLADLIREVQNEKKKAQKQIGQLPANSAESLNENLNLTKPVKSVSSDNVSFKTDVEPSTLARENSNLKKKIENLQNLLLVKC
jgi:hypothetical protein